MNQETNLQQVNCVTLNCTKKLFMAHILSQYNEFNDKNTTWPIKRYPDQAMLLFFFISTNDRHISFTFESVFFLLLLLFINSAVIVIVCDIIRNDE